MRLLYATALVVVAVATPVLAKDKIKQAPADTVACSGVFGIESSEALVIETFGKDNVVTGNVPGPEGTEYLATTVFPDDPDRKMEFSWFDDETRVGLASVELAPSQTGPFGVKLGMTPAEVEAVNGEGFQIGGFWWDYGGYANIASGKLAGPLEGDCYPSLRFSPADEYSPAIDVTPVAGEVQVPSDEGLLEVLDTRLTVLSLGYSWPETEDDAAGN